MVHVKLPFLIIKRSFGVTLFALAKSAFRSYFEPILWTLKLIRRCQNWFRQDTVGVARIPDYVFLLLLIALAGVSVFSIVDMYVDGLAPPAPKILMSEESGPEVRIRIEGKALPFYQSIYVLKRVVGEQRWSAQPAQLSDGVWQAELTLNKKLQYEVYAVVSRPLPTDQLIDTPSDIEVISKVIKLPK